MSKIINMKIHERNMKKAKMRNMKKKIYEIIGRIVVFLSIYVGAVALMVWAFMQNTVY